MSPYPSDKDPPGKAPPGKAPPDKDPPGTRRGEFDLIETYFKPLAKGAPGALGLADDAAVLTPTGGHDLVVTQDMLVEGVHFRDTDPAGRVAQKALRVNLSDLAAMGATPVAYLLSLALPAAVDDAWVAAAAAGLAADQAEFGVHLIGGDTVSTPGPLTLSITALGQTPNGLALRRSGARPGDLVMVSGMIGDACLGLDVLEGGDTTAPGAPGAPGADYLVDRYQLPSPRLSLGLALRGLATAAIDISDGLVADLGHLCGASGVGAAVDLGRVPVSPAAAPDHAAHDRSDCRGR